MVGYFLVLQWLNPTPASQKMFWPKKGTYSTSFVYSRRLKAGDPRVYEAGDSCPFGRKISSFFFLVLFINAFPQTQRTQAWLEVGRKKAWKRKWWDACWLKSQLVGSAMNAMVVVAMVGNVTVGQTDHDLDHLDPSLPL